MPHGSYRTDARPLIAERPTDQLANLGKRVVVMGDCYVVDGEPDRYPYAGGTHAYRFVWESIHGPVGCDDHIHHVCRTKGCIRPDHLQRLTRREHYDEHADD
mgnify:FL=1